MSAVGGLAGALLQERSNTRRCCCCSAGCFLFTAAAELTGFGRRLRFRGRSRGSRAPHRGCLAGSSGTRAAYVRRRCSGSICRSRRSSRRPQPLGLMVDAARVPVYLWYMGDDFDQLRGLDCARDGGRRGRNGHRESSADGDTGTIVPANRCHRAGAARRRDGRSRGSRRIKATALH